VTFSFAKGMFKIAGNKETAFLFAISSAGLAYSVSRACSSGHLERCSCEGSLKEASEEWMWGG